MFKKRTLQVSVVKEQPKNTGTIYMGSRVTPEQVSNTAKDFVTHTVATIGTAYVIKKILDTTCELAVIAAKAKLK